MKLSAEAQTKAHSLNLWPRSQRSSLPSALSQAVCWVTAFRNPLRKPGNLAQTFLEDRTIQIYSNNMPETPHYIFIGGARQDTGTRREETLYYNGWSRCVYLWPLNSKSYCVGVEVIYQNRKGDVFLFQLSLLVWPFLNSWHSYKKGFRIPLVKMTKLSQSNSAQLRKFNLAALLMTMSPLAAAVMGWLHFSLRAQFEWLICERAEVQSTQRLSFVHNEITQESRKFN